jgi:hypothetical protein
MGAEEAADAELDERAAGVLEAEVWAVEVGATGSVEQGAREKAAKEDAEPGAKRVEAVVAAEAVASRGRTVCAVAALLDAELAG